MFVHLVTNVSSLQSKLGELPRSSSPTPWHILCDPPSNKYVLAENKDKNRSEMTDQSREERINLHQAREKGLAH